MKQKPFYQCEHCVYYTPYYNICEDRIWQVDYGYCELKKKKIKPSLRNCQHFRLLSESKKYKEKQEKIQDYEQQIYNVLHRIEQSIKSFKTFLNKDRQGQKIDGCLINDRGH
ncbi:MAG: hypothetical protein IJ371_01665 [Clostridia bacterium]|nr:hypothetical protein [Clostridia bacterium]